MSNIAPKRTKDVNIFYYLGYIFQGRHKLYTFGPFSTCFTSECKKSSSPHKSSLWQVEKFPAGRLVVAGKLRVNTCLRVPTNIILGPCTTKNWERQNFETFCIQIQLWWTQLHNYTITITKHSKDRLETSHFQFNHDFDWYQLPKAQCSVNLTIEFSSRRLPSELIFWSLATFSFPWFALQGPAFPCTHWQGLPR